MRTDDHITKIGGRDDPWFDDIRIPVMSSRENEQIEIQWKRNGVLHDLTTVAPIRDEGQRFPQLGVAPPNQLTLPSGNKRRARVTYPGTPAAEATSADGTQKFEPGDRIIAMTDPTTKEVTPVENYNEYYRRMVLLGKANITFRVQRKGSEQTAEIIVKPTFRHDLGMRLRMGKVAALRKGGSAEKAGVVAASKPELVGDIIKAVLLPPDKDGNRLWYVAGPVDWDKDEFKLSGLNPKQVQVQPLDPLLLPHQLNQWAADKTGMIPLDLVVSREDAQTHTIASTRITLNFDTSFRFDRESTMLPNSPLPLSGLGLAYWVEGLVDFVEPGGPAAAAGVQVGDVITGVQFKARDDGNNLKVGEWKDDLKPHQWASVDSVYQLNSPELNIKVQRGKEIIELSLTGKPATDWPTYDRGLIFLTETKIDQADGVGDAIRLGGLRTIRFIKGVYLSLYGYINGRISVKTLSGPLTIANVSYKLAGEDFWQFLLFLGLISVNLAVVNFLPIPVLDGGHMVFLILEKILGRPVPERMFAFAMYTGLFLILTLMVFVLFLDVGRLFFGMF
jgi:regulator of sigma E protease